MMKLFFSAKLSMLHKKHAKKKVNHNWNVNEDKTAEW